MRANTGGDAKRKSINRVKGRGFKILSFLILISLAITAITLLPSARAANPTSGTLSATSTTALTWSGTATAGASATGENVCQEGINCDSYTLNISGQPSDWAGKQVRVKIAWTAPTTDYDLYIHKDTVAGPLVKQSAGGPPATAEQALIDPSQLNGTGVYIVHVVYATATAADQYQGSAAVETAQQVTPAPQATGTGPRFNNFPAPNGFGSRAGEPSIGTNWQTGKAFFLAGFQALRITFDDSVSPAKALWEDKSPPSATSLDPIMFTDHMRAAGDNTPDRTFVSQLTGQDSITFFTDDDGESYLPSQGGGIPSGVDHQTIGAGPYSSNGAPPVHTYPNAVYYCSQELVTAFCARSDDGGLTFGPGVPIYTSECGGIHGHVKVAPDGSVYVPNRDCGGLAGVSRSTDNGITWSVKTVPTSSTTGFLVDPSLGIGTNSVGKPNGQTVNTLYLGYQAGDGHAHLAVSHDEGNTWVNDRDVSALAGLANTTFPEVVAGDDNRVAYAFLGTTTAGNYTDPTSYPDSAEWHLYIATSYDGGASYFLADVTPNDPVQRGTICNLGTTPCQDHSNAGYPDRNLLDFMDATIDKMGHVLVGYPDGCVSSTCINGQPSSSGHPNDYASLGTIARQSGGKSLFAAYDSTVSNVPAAPQVVASIDGDTSYISWSTPDDGGSPITTYRIYKGNGASESLLASVGADVNSYTDRPSSATNYYRVAAVNANGEGAKSARVSPTVLVQESACTLPGITVIQDGADAAPNTPAVAQVDIKSVSIAEPYDGGINKLVFTLKIGAGDGSIPANSQWYIIWNRLNPDANYDRNYVAMKSGVTGGLSFEYGKVSYPIQYTNPGTNQGNLPTKFGDAQGSYNAQTGAITITVTNDKVDNIAAGQTMQSIEARTFLGRDDNLPINQNLSSDYAAGGTYQLIGNAACQLRIAAPTALTVFNSAKGEATLNWKDNSNNELNFIVERSTAVASGFTEVARLNANVTAYADHGLARKITYYYRVRAANGNTYSEYSNTASVRIK